MNEIILEVNGDRKRIIGIDYILRRLFILLKNPIADKISDSKSKKTREKNDQYWNQVLKLIGGKINTIINGVNDAEIKKTKKGKVVIISE